MQMILSKVKMKYQNWEVFSSLFMVVSLQVFKKEIFRCVCRTLSDIYNEAFLAKIGNVF